MFRRQPLHQVDGLVEPTRHDDSTVRRQRLPRRPVGWELILHFARHGLRQAQASRDQDRARIRVVLGLRDEVRRNPRRPAGRREHGNLARSGEEIDGAVLRDERLGRGDVGIAWSDDAIDARHSGRAVGQRCDGVRAAEPEEPRHSRLERRIHDGRIRLRTDRDDVRHARHARRNRGHEQGRGQGIAAPRDVAADTIERQHPLPDPDAWHRADRPRARPLLLCHRADVPGGEGDRLLHVRIDERRALFDLPAADLDRSIEPVEPARVGEQRRIAVAPHASDDRRDPPLNSRITRRPLIEQRRDRTSVRGFDNQHDNCCPRTTLTMFTTLTETRRAR